MVVGMFASGDAPRFDQASESVVGEALEARLASSRRVRAGTRRLGADEILSLTAAGYRRSSSTSLYFAAPVQFGSMLPSYA